MCSSFTIIMNYSSCCINIFIQTFIIVLSYNFTKIHTFLIHSNFLTHSSKMAK